MKKVLRYLSLAAVSFGSNTFLFFQSVQLDWAIQFGSAGFSVGSSVKADTAGNVYTTGHFTGITDFDPGIGVYQLTANWLQENT